MKAPKDIKYVLVEFNSFLKKSIHTNCCLVIIYIKVHIPDSEEIKKDSMFKWGWFVIKKSISTCMIGFYVYKSLSSHIEFLETVQINSQQILHFVHLWSKEVPVNIIYPSIVNTIDGYFDASISPICVKYLITRDKHIR